MRVLTARARGGGTSPVRPPAPLLITMPCALEMAACQVPAGPGLGLDPDVEVLNRYRLGSPVVIER
jgi:hypothetical protein